LANELNRRFSNEVQMANRHVEKWPKPLAIREMPIKTTVRFYSPQSQWLSSRKQTTDTGGDGGGVILLVGMSISPASMEIIMAVPQKCKTRTTI
jgi:hypothetical protein